jgi:hypothetical protein
MRGRAAHQDSMRLDAAHPGGGHAGGARAGSGGRRGSGPRARAWYLAFGLRQAFVPAVLAVDPTSSPAGGGDVRTNPAAPGLAGDPLFALLGVGLVGLLAVAMTLVAVRLTSRR